MVSRGFLTDLPSSSSSFPAPQGQSPTPASQPALQRSDGIASEWPDLGHLQTRNMIHLPEGVWANRLFCLWAQLWGNVFHLAVRPDVLGGSTCLADIVYKGAPVSPESKTILPSKWFTCTSLRSIFLFLNISQKDLK